MYISLFSYSTENNITWIEVLLFYLFTVNTLALTSVLDKISALITCWHMQYSNNMLFSLLEDFGLSKSIENNIPLKWCL